MTEVRQIPVCQIVPGNNDRKTLDPAKLAELASSISAHGLAQPITLRPGYLCYRCEAFDREKRERCPSCGGESWTPIFQVIAGERRLRAIRDILRWPEAPAIIREDLTEEGASSDRKSSAY